MSVKFVGMVKSWEKKLTQIELTTPKNEFDLFNNHAGVVSILNNRIDWLPFETGIMHTHDIHEGLV